MASIRILEIIDSRGNPTLQASYEDSTEAIRAQVPSGASTGTHEAVELRDGGEAYMGKGVSKAAKNAQSLADELVWEPADYSKADEQMIASDGTKDKSKLGANAILALSMLQARVQAQQQGKPLFALLADAAGTAPSMPLPFANVINGGRHAGNALMLQEFMIVPHKATSFSDATRQVVETTHALRAIIAERYGAQQTAVGDEGGFAPEIRNAEEACELLVEAAKAAGHDLAIAMDPAASEFYEDGRYQIEQGRYLTSDELIEYWLSLIEKYPIISLEDPFEQEDFGSFARLRSRIAERGLSCQVVGDDLTVTNPERIRVAAQHQACDCLLLKVNQIGSVSESLTAARLALDSGWSVMVSHRSGETTDDFIADLAVALGSGQIKLGAPVRGERTVKYNRLLEIEAIYALPMAALIR